MRIGFNARTLAAPQVRGWTRYTVQLLRNLPEFGVELVLFTDAPLNAEHLSLLVPGSFKVIQAPRMRYLEWEQGWLPLASARERIDVLHAPANYGLPMLGTCPRIVTLHDAIDVAFEPSSGPNGLRARLVQASFWAARRVARQIITVSAHAKADLVKYYSIPASRVKVIHEASDLLERTATSTEEQQLFEELRIPGRFVLYAGGFERRKNVPFLIDAFREAALPGVTLVLVGGVPSPDIDLGRADDACIVRTGFISDAALAALYRRALVFVYPSLYEGFGLQLCEAMSFACPTIAANATSLPEVLGSGGETFSPTDRETLVALLRRIAEDPAYRGQLSERAALRAQQFSWRRTAQATCEVYRQAKG